VTARNMASQYGSWLFLTERAWGLCYFFITSGWEIGNHS
jgi:hypothetical protein